MTEGKPTSPELVTAARGGVAGEHLRTDDVRAELGARTARGGAVTIASQGVRFALMIGMTAVLGRLLVPEDYGLVGMAFIVTGFVTMFKDLGLSSATIQREDLTAGQVSTLFWVNIGFSIVTMLLTFALAPAVAWFFGDARLTAVTVAYAVGFIFSGLAVQHEALLRRRMRFAALAGANLAALAVNATVTIGLAWAGFGYWALVYGQLALGLSYTICVWAVCGWRPGRPGRLSEVKSLLAFGRDLTGFTIINYFARNLDNLLIGRVWGAVQLGFYAKAYQLLLLPLDQVIEPVTSVAVPALSRLNDTPERYRQAYLRLLEKVAMVTMPLMAFMTVTADWIVRIVLGPQWGEAALIFSILGVAAIMQPVASTAGWLFVTQGRARQMLQWGLIGPPLLILFIVAGLPWGAVGVAASYTAGYLCVVAPLLLWYVGRGGHVRTRDIYRAVAPMLLAAVCAAAAVLIFRWAAGPLHPLVGLAASFGIAASVTLLLFALLPRGRRALQDLSSSLMVLAGRRRQVGGA
jgi:O-antigen/teichoic acid export membrane protein